MFENRHSEDASSEPAAVSKPSYIMPVVNSLDFAEEVQTFLELLESVANIDPYKKELLVLDLELLSNACLEDDPDPFKICSAAYRVGKFFKEAFESGLLFREAGAQLDNLLKVMGAKTYSVTIKFDEIAPSELREEFIDRLRETFRAKGHYFPIIPSELVSLD